jgi:putative toxin-antitoxin system antitoxin component (TIGR02293 family)
LRDNTDFSVEDTLRLTGIPRRTLTRRKREGRFPPDEADRLLRGARVFGRAMELFGGDSDAAAAWLSTSQPALGGRVPLDAAASDVGAREVERVIGRLEHGVFS